MKGAVNGAAGMCGVELCRQGTNARDQIVEGRRAKLVKREFEGNSPGFRCIPKRSAAIEPRVEQCPVFVQIKTQ